ncbi:MAG: DUF6754 domain-containing protein [candidate division Zixibacteria bacterium]|nr:DUF6754 domain-containing protein [candidate division Zixibacteria bacterium]
MKLKTVIFICLLLLATISVSAQEGAEIVPETDTTEQMPPPAPISLLTAVDTDNDNGHSVTLTWELSPDDRQGAKSVMSYEIFRWVPLMRDTVEQVRSELANTGQELEVGDPTGEIKEKRNRLRDEYEGLLSRYSDAYGQYPNNGVWKSVGVSPSGSTTFADKGSKEREAFDYLPDYCDFYYQVFAVTSDAGIRTGSEIFGPVHSYGQWFNTGRIPIFVAVLFFSFLTIYFVQRAKKGDDLYVRPLAGIEAVDDAIGRATEMGKPILYVLGLGTASDVATIASFTILGRVAKKVAEYQTALIVPTYDPIVMTVAQEVVKSAYIDAGRPDDFKEDTVHFVTQSQFAYVAAVNGTMLRELPATNIYMGKFFAESLLLAETGAVAGSIQIAGTDEIAQIPFFIVACDYTLIGEELYAASAYLGREPVLLGSLKAQDWAKAALVILGIAGLVAANLGWTDFTDLFHVIN